jgi:stress response protein SCP2
MTTDIVSFSNLKCQGIMHRGDNTTGEGAGDDERIRIEFANVRRETVEIFVAVNVYSTGKTFNHVRDAYVRVAVASQPKGFNPGHVLAQYPLDGSIPTSGLVFCKFVRSGASWNLQALG